MIEDTMMYSEFSKQEYQKRRKEASRIMQERGVDGMLITTATNIRYFATALLKDGSYLSLR